MAVVAGDEILHFRGRSVLELVAADEVVGKLVLLGIGGLAIHLGHGDTIAVRTVGGAVSVHLGLGREAQWQICSEENCLFM